MGSVDDRLRKKNYQKNKEKDSYELIGFNQKINELDILIPKIIREIEIDPPNYCKCVKVENDINETVVWLLLFNKNNDYDNDHFSCYISANGQIISQDYDKYYCIKLNRVVSLGERPVFNKYKSQHTVDSGFLIGLLYALNEFYNKMIYSRWTKQPKKD